MQNLPLGGQACPSKVANLVLDRARLEADKRLARMVIYQISIPMNKVFSHQAQQRQFQLDWGGHIAWVDYDIRDNIWYLLHAQVPPALRGQGVGQVLVEQTYAYLREHKHASVPVCSYIQAQLKRHPHWLNGGAV